jgi:sulfate transport system ATP-binding protein
VTHDQEEAFEVADHVVVMNEGKIEQMGTPQEVFEHPANAFVMDFLGNVNVFHGRVEHGKAHLSGLPGLEVSYPDYPHSEARDAAVYVRPHELLLEHHANGSAGIQAKVLHVNPTGSIVKVELGAVEDARLINAELTAERFAELALKLGDIVHVSARKVRVFMPDYSI